MNKKNKNKRPGAFRIVLYTLLIACFIVISSKFHGLHAASYAKKIEVKLKDGQDATKEIQNALDEAAKAGTAKKQALVSVPKGTFYISQTLRIGSNTYLKLDKKTTIKKNPKASVLYMLSIREGKKGKYSDYSNITVKGGTWDAEFRKFNDTSGGSIFFFAHTSKLKIMDATLCNNFGTHLIELGGVKNCTIKGCELYGFKTYSGGTEKEAIQLDICHSYDILPGGAPFDDTPCTGITVTKCKIHDYPRAIGSHMMVKDIYHTDITISDNKIYDIPKAAVYGYNYSGLTIKDNTMKNVWCGVQLKTDSTVKKTKLERNSGVKAMKLKNGEFDINIINNTIMLSEDVSKEDQDSGSSISIFIYGSEEYPIKKALIKDNTVTCCSAGVYLRYVDSCDIIGNHVDRIKSAQNADSTKFVEDAIKLMNSANARIEDNIVSGNSSNPFENGIGLREYCTNTKVNGNTLNMAVKSGIGLYSTCSITEGKGNTISNSGTNGITVMDAEINLDDCTITGSTAKGISVQGDSKIVLKNSRIKDNHNNGLQVLKGKMLITGNTFSNNCLDNTSDKAVAIFANATGEISNNTFSDPDTNYELWIATGTKLSPQISSAKTSKVSGTRDIAGNQF